MRLEVARETDSDRLKEFFARMILPGAMDLSVIRHGSFFDQYRLQSDDFETLMLLDDDDQIQGIASLIFREGVLHSERQMFGYATDLRIAPTRQAVLQWAQHFLPVLEKALETRGCRYVFSAIERADNQAYNALVRPQQVRRHLPRYYLLRRFHVVGVHGKLPFAKAPLATIRLANLEMKDVGELCQYMRLKGKEGPFSLVLEEDAFLKRIERWPGLSLSDFRIARDGQGRILGCAAPWSSSQVQSFVPMKYHGFADTLRQMIKVGGWLRLLTPLPRPNNPLRPRFLTHLHADGPEVFERLLDDALTTTPDGELLMYTHFRGNLATLPPRSAIITGLPYALYSVLPPQATLPDFLQPDPWRPPPPFEAAWL